MKTLDLFSGVGGMMALIPHKTVLYVEADEFCQRVLAARTREGALSRPSGKEATHIHPDIRTLTADHPALKGTKIDLIAGGWPCQDISSIGVQRGLQRGTRSALFFEVMRLVGQLTPPFVFLENVRALLSNRKVWQPVLTHLHKLGYDTTWTLVGADDLGAPHRRKRFFILGRRRSADQEKSPPPIRLPRGPKLWESGCCIGGDVFPLPLPGPVAAMAPPMGDIIQDQRTGVSRALDHWTTPRAGIRYACARLTERCCGDLPSQLRFARSTPAAHRMRGKVVVSNPQWIEWLMGFPQNWTDPDARADRSHRGWKMEPRGVPRVVQSATPHAVARNQALGNACVPGTAAVAWARCMQNLGVTGTRKLKRR